MGTYPTHISALLGNGYYWRCRALTKVPIMLSNESIDKFVRHQNVERYRRLLENITDENRRAYLVKLFTEAKQKQKDAGDPECPY